MNISSRKWIAIVPVLFGLNYGALAEGFLRTKGQDIIDEKGQTILLRGVGLGNWMLPEGYMWKFGEKGDRPRKIEKLISEMVGEEAAAKFWTEYRRKYITETDIARVAELGFNCVRPALNARLFLSESHEAKYLEEGFSLLDQLVSWSKAHGIYVIIDMHAAPGGQTGANIDDSIQDQPRLWIDLGYQDRLVALWVKIAERYKDNPAVAAYDLLNEPLPDRTGSAGKYKKQLEPLYKRITEAIRKVDTKHMITIEGADWANDWSMFSTPFDSNLVYQFHYYCWDKPVRLKNINQYLRYRTKLNAPILAGETGEKDEPIYWGTTDYFESLNVSWSFWPWKKMSTRNTPYSIKAPEGWNAIAAFSEGKSKPTSQEAQRTLDQLLKNIELENCTYFPSVVNALFHRAPSKIEAENFGHQGTGKSFSVKSNIKARHYRVDDFVPIEPTEVPGGRGAGGFIINLSSQDWTSYPINSAEEKSFGLKIKARARGESARFQVTVNEQIQEATLSDSNWTEVKLQPVTLKKGANNLKIQVMQGTVSFDWFEIR